MSQGIRGDGVMNLFDKVVLIEDIAGAALLKGMVGSVVEIYNHGEAYEIEFIDPSGHTYAVETIDSSKLLKLIYEPVR
jgi:hypothetical protein